MAEATRDFGSSVAFLRTRWYLVTATALVGLGLGVFYSTLVPIQLGSKSILLVTGRSSSGAATDPGIITQVEIVRSTPVLARAGRSVTPQLSTAQVGKMIEVDALTSQLIEIQAFSPRARDAEALAQAVAEAYVGTLVDSARSVTGAVVADLKVRRDDLVRQIRQLQVQINATTGRSARESAQPKLGIRDAQLKAQLTAEQANIAGQLDTVKSELAASDAVDNSATSASFVQSADPATGPGRLPGMVSWGAAGALSERQPPRHALSYANAGTGGCAPGTTWRTRSAAPCWPTYGLVDSVPWQHGPLCSRRMSPLLSTPGPFDSCCVRSPLSPTDMAPDARCRRGVQYASSIPGR
jgi:hypothetical protein